MSQKPVRVRIAPSPTGEPHVGTAYIALFNRAFARSHGGKFVLRIEDTDQARSTRESELSIYASLRWLGLTWDEGPDVGGPFGPYRQSERTATYQEYGKKLLESGRAYRCFCTAERLAELRKKQMAEKSSRLGYDGFCRGVAAAESKKRAEAGEVHVVRLLVPDPGETSFRDAIRQDVVTTKNGEIDDQILLKSDGFPTYHLANVVDDHLMEITHVIRAEEWIPSTPKHVLLYQAFGWEPPVFAHMPLLRNADKSKISKRKNPVSLRWYRAAGYLPPALLNFLALMGGGPKEGDVEIFGVDALETGFEIEKIKTTQPVFDLAKLEWMNGQYVQHLSPEAFADALADRARAAAEYLRPLLVHLGQRVKRTSEFDRWTETFFLTSLDYDAALLVPKKGPDKARTLDLLNKVKKLLKDLEGPTAASMEAAAREVAEKDGQPPEVLFMTLRVAVTGQTTSLPLFESMEMMGRDVAVARLDAAAGKLKQLK